MRGLVGAAILGAAIVGCGHDLFHSTSWDTLCDLTPHDPSCPKTSGTTASGAGGTGGLASTGGALAGGASTSGGGCTPVSMTESCSTPADDNCNGYVNEGCPPTGYAFAQTPDMGSLAYFDELHNVNTTGSATDNSRVGTFAAGQLTDGAKGVDDVSADLGNGPAYEWVGWSGESVDVTFDFGVARDFDSVVLGTNNSQGGGIYEPLEIDISFSQDGSQFASMVSFRLDNGTLPSIPVGTRADLTLSVPRTLARYLRVTLLPAGPWIFLDELNFQ